MKMPGQNPNGSALDKAAAKLSQSSKAMSAHLRQLDLPTVRRPTGQAAAAPPESTSATASKKKKEKSVDTNLPDKKRVGNEWKALQQQQSLRHQQSATTLGGKLYQIMEYLKETETAQTAEQIKAALKLDVIADRNLADLITKTSKIQVENGRYSYKPEYMVRNKSDLIELVKKHWMSGLGGLHVRDLKDQWKQVSTVIEELASSQEVLCVRTKDGKPIVLFYNELAGSFNSKEFDEFRELWKQFPIPENPDDLQRELSGAGLKSLEVQREQSTGEQTQKRKVRRSRAIKITNTHLKDIDLTVDYKHPHESKKPC